MKQFAMILLAAATLVGGVGVASAQHGGSHGSMGGGGWQGGGGSQGGGGWHGGGGWQGGGGWHGGGWHGGGWHGGGWHGSHVVVGVGFGYPWWGWGYGWWPGYYYPYYPAYYPSYPYYPDAYYPSDYSAPTYIQQGAPASSERSYSPGGQYSYYCPDPAGYYPQVPTCNREWLRVLPPSAPGPAAPESQ